MSGKRFQIGGDRRLLKLGLPIGRIGCAEAMGAPDDEIKGWMRRGGIATGI